MNVDYDKHFTQTFGCALILAAPAAAELATTAVTWPYNRKNLRITQEVAVSSK